jgi:hypothetical protein
VQGFPEFAANDRIISIRASLLPCQIHYTDVRTTSMKRKSLEKLRLDRRLAGRHGWISTADLTAEAEALPDASEKIAPKEAQPDPGEVDAVQPEAGSKIPTPLEPA